MHKGKYSLFPCRAKHTANLLGKDIQYARKIRNWSEKDLAERAGISRRTLPKIESGEMTVAIGLVFETAVILGIPLFLEKNIRIRSYDAWVIQWILIQFLWNDIDWSI